MTAISILYWVWVASVTERVPKQLSHWQLSLTNRVHRPGFQTTTYLLQFRVRSESPFASTPTPCWGPLWRRPLRKRNISTMQAANGHDRFQRIVARAPQVTPIQTSSTSPSTTSTPGLFFPDPSNMPLSPINDNKSTVKVRHPGLCFNFFDIYLDFSLLSSTFSWFSHYSLPCSYVWEGRKVSLCMCVIVV